MDYTPFADLYDRQYALYRDDLHFYADLARGAGSVLELGAGSGRVTLCLARTGARVTGLELSEGMLERARARLARAGLEARLVRGDMRDFDLQETFDLIAAPFNALMHLYTPREQLAALKNVRRHLSPGGTFAFDVYLPTFGPEGVLRHEGETFYEDGARTDVFVVQRVDRLHQLATTQYFADTSENGVLRRAHHTLTQRYYTRYELEWLLRHAGLAPRFAGAFEGGPLEAGSAVMVVTCRADR